MKNLTLSIIMSSLLLTFPILSNPTLIPTAFSQEGPGSAAAVTITPGAADEGNLEPFDPNAINVMSGSTVSWTNEYSTEHTVTANEGGLFDSGPIPPGMVWDNMFDSPGTFGYHCVIHPWMSSRDAESNSYDMNKLKSDITQQVM